MRKIGPHRFLCSRRLCLLRARTTDPDAKQVKCHASRRCGWQADTSGGGSNHDVRVPGLLARPSRSPRHHGGSRAAMNLRGMMEAPPEGRQTFTYEHDLLHGHSYTQQIPDVHYTKGMACIDCHTEREMHGDGRIYAKRHYEVEVRCENCHGTPERVATGPHGPGPPAEQHLRGHRPEPHGPGHAAHQAHGPGAARAALATRPTQPPGHDSSISRSWSASPATPRGCRPATAATSRWTTRPTKPRWTWPLTTWRTRTASKAGSG